MGLLADADILILRINGGTDSNEPDRAPTQQIIDAPLWATLPAVAAGAVFEISEYLFYTSPLTAEANLGWAEQNLLA